MDAAKYLADIVEPTLRDFESNPTSVRHAFLACVVTFHCIDYLAAGNSSGNLRKKFRNESPDFAVIDRVAHAFKHVHTGNLRAGDNRPLKAEEVIARPPAFWGMAVWDLSRWDDATGGVTLAREVDCDLLQLVRRAADFLRTKSHK